VTGLDVVVALAAGAVVGAVVGLVFFGGLWWTSRRLADTSHPALLVTVSLVVRLALVAVVLVSLARTAPPLLLGALVGLLAARLILTRAATGGRLPTSELTAGPPEGRS
jgi:F1F0 ATPase subunit 2